MASISTLVNPLATVAQLETSASQLDGVPADLETSVRFQGCKLTQAAGALLRLPQDITAQAVVVFTRFWVGSGGGSLREYGTEDISAAAVYLVAKPSSLPKSPRSVLNTYAYLKSQSHSMSTLESTSTDVTRPKPESYFLSDGAFYARRDALMKHEVIILRALGFQIHVAIPHTLCVNFLQALDMFADHRGSALAKRAFAHLNTLLLSPQLIYLTHQPFQIATAAIYLTAREIGVKLPEEEWWEVFDTDREELGFLVVAMTSMNAFASAEKQKWASKKVPMSVTELETELIQRASLEKSD